MLIATEGAQWGSIHAHGFLQDAVVLSDDAGQFAIGRHALCWVHAERLVHKLDTFTDLHRAAQQRIRKLIWKFYADLKIYRVSPSQNRRLALRARFDRIFRRRTGFVTLDRLLAAAPCQQGRVADGAASGRKSRCIPTAPKTISAARSPGARSAPEPAATWPRLPRCLPRACQNLRQAWRGVLGLSGQSADSPRSAGHPAVVATRPMPRSARLRRRRPGFCP